MKRIFFILCVCLNLLGVAQDKLDYVEKPFYIGFGLGMDYGGIGGKLEYMFLNHAGLFGGIGYNFHSLGWNTGIMLKATPKEMITPYLLGMYGYTGVIRIVNASEYDFIDFGFSLGGGFEIKTKQQNVWQFGVILPFRSNEFKDHHQALQDNPAIEFNNNLSLLAFSVGFKIVIH